MAPHEMNKMITLVASDRKVVGVEKAVAMKSETIRQIIEDDCTKHVIHIPNVSSTILYKVFLYCEMHLKHSLPDVEELMEFDNEFANVEANTLGKLMLAAKYLEVKNLVDLLCQRTADLIKGKSAEEIRQFFNINNDFTPEEEEKIRKEIEWASK